MQKTDDATIRRFYDLAELADKRYAPTFSNFLNLNEISLLKGCKELPLPYTLYGGYEAAERQMAAFHSDAFSDAITFPIVCLEIRPTGAKFAENLTHRDLLGAILHTGIDRSLIGDIITRDPMTYVFCQNSIADYLIHEVHRIKHTSVVITATDEREMAFPQSFLHQHYTIASNRLDAFVASACKLSRAKSADYVLGEKVFINSRLCTNHNTALSVGDIISLRGFGKLKITEIGSLTKKGRLWIEVDWYQ